MKRLCFSIGCLAASFFLAIGCATTKTHPGASKCFDQCNLDYMTCLEEMGCTAENGQRIPCENECNAEKSECTGSCG